MTLEAQNKIRRITLYAGFATCLLVISLALYLAYLETNREAKQLLDDQAKSLKMITKQFFQKTLLSLEKIDKQQLDCKRQTNQLTQLVLNEPEISIAYLKNSDDACATIKNFDFNSLPSYQTSAKATILSGPLKIPGIIQNAYAIRLVRPTYEIGAIFPKQILNEFIINRSDPLIRISLIDNDKTIFGAKTLPSTPPYLQSNDSLSNVDNINLQISLDQGWIIDQLTPHFLLALVIASLVSLVLIFLIYRITRHRLSLEMAIKSALKEHQFIPYYQPVKDLQTNQYCGVECLMRWQLNEDEMLYPDFFIPAAEKSGLIKPMTQQLIQQIFDDLGEYCQSNPDFHLGINLSPCHFRDRELFELVKQKCADFNIQPQQIIFEVTEQELIEEDNDYAVAIMKDMRQLGFSLALDDFGTGYSSISYLQKFPFDFLKIDKQFVMAIGTKAVTAQLAASMIDLAKNLQLTVIAEGVETTAHEAYLQSRGVSIGQGWLYSKAISIEALREFLNKALSLVPN